MLRLLTHGYESLFNHVKWLHSMHGSYAYSTYIAIYYLFSIVKKTNISLNNKGEIMNFEKIKSDIEKFVSSRKWQDYHTPKNLSMALSVEASELMEIFQ